MSNIERVSSLLYKNPNLNRRDLLQKAAVAAAATLLLESDNSDEGKQLGGIWEKPKEKYALVPPQTTISVKAYPTPGYKSRVSKVLLTLDPSSLNNPENNPNVTEAQKKQVREGHWLVIAELPQNGENVYNFSVDFSLYHPFPSAELKISFDVYGYNEDKTPTVNRSPQGEHILYLQEQQNNIDIQTIG